MFGSFIVTSAKHLATATATCLVSMVIRIILCFYFIEWVEKSFTKQMKPFNVH